MNKFPRLFLHGLLSVFLMAAAGSSVSAQEVRIGAVNLDSIVRDSALAKSLTAKLEQDFSPREKEIQALGVQLKSSSEKFEREAPTLPEAQRIISQAPGMPQAWQMRMLVLDAAQGLEEIVLPGLCLHLLKRVYRFGRRPGRAFHRMISPRSVLRSTVSVKLLRDT